MTVHELNPKAGVKRRSCGEEEHSKISNKCDLGLRRILGSIFFPALLGLFGKRLYREAANVEEKLGG